MSDRTGWESEQEMFVNMTLEALLQRNNEWQSEFARFQAGADYASRTLLAQVAEGVRARKNEIALTVENLRLSNLAQSVYNAEQGNGAQELHVLRAQYGQHEARLVGEREQMESKCSIIKAANAKKDQEIKAFSEHMKELELHYKGQLSLMRLSRVIALTRISMRMLTS